MLKKTVTYTDYFDVERTEDYMFNLTKAELAKMNMSQYGGLEKRLRAIIDANDMPTVMENFRQILRQSYGVISDDGRRFMKSEEISDAFEQSPAYDQIFMELISSADAAAAFARGIMPKDLVEAVDKERAKAASQPTLEVVN